MIPFSKLNLVFEMGRVQMPSNVCSVKLSGGAITWLRVVDCWELYRKCFSLMFVMLLLLEIFLKSIAILLCIVPGAYFINVCLSGIMNRTVAFLHREVDVLLFEVIQEKQFGTTALVDFKINIKGMA